MQNGVPFTRISGGDDHRFQHLWKEFFNEPSRWWDNRNRKQNSKQPDFIHNITKEALWTDSKQNPFWESDELLKQGFTVEYGAILTSKEALSPELIWACCKHKDLFRGTELHHEIKRRGLIERIYSDALITMYAKCGELKKARTLMDAHISSNFIPWNALIGGYVRQEQFHEALNCFEEMQQEQVSPSALTYGYILKACAATRAIDKGKQIHYEVLRQGFLEHNAVLGGALVDMYAKCSALSHAQDVLEKLPIRNHISWSALICGYANNGQGEQALSCFERMKEEGIPPNEVIFTCTLKACASVREMDKGKQIHDEILSQGLLENNVELGTALVDMYGKCGALSQAQDVLKNLPSRNHISWSALISTCTQNGQGQEALHCFEQMQADGVVPDAVTYACILKACGSVGSIDKGKQIHDEILRKGLLEHNVVLGSALVDMYAKCGALSQAQATLGELASPNVISWNSLIAGYVHSGSGEQALLHFKKMQAQDIAPDTVTYTCILKACALIGDINKGRQIHDEILMQGLLERDVALGGALVDMYAKCGALHQAQGVLEKLPSRDVISWSALIAGYVRNGQAQHALDCFKQMQAEGIAPNQVTYICILAACASTGAIDRGKEIHEKILTQGLLQHHMVLGNALVDMYAKCGALLQAQHVLEELPIRSVVAWSSLIAGYTENRQGQQALVCFEQMQTDCVAPDPMTYASILKACASIGNIIKGKQIHDEISRKGLLEHDVVLGNALVDLYAKCGALLQAKDVLEKLSYRNVVSWNALISGYAQEGPAQEAFKCYEKMKLEGILPDAVTFLCLLNVCSHLGMVKKGQELFDTMEAYYGLKPNIECFNCMIGLLGRAGHLGKAVDLIRDMPFPGNITTWQALLGACHKWVNVDVGRWAFEQMLELDKCDLTAYVLMANIYTAAGMQDKASTLEALRMKNKAGA